MRRTHLIPLLLVIAGAGAAAWLGLRHTDPHYATERRAWKNRAIEEVKQESATPPDPDARYSEDEWLTTGKIACADGSWLAYRSQCHKQDPKVWDIFIAKASDGRWYYSDFHFCIGAMVLGMRGQPESLEKFKSDYFLAEFDGSSDAALSPTWRIAR
jgi:hypothetical protein